MLNEIQAIVFDLDDTLVDSRKGIELYYSELFEYLGLPMPPKEKYHLLYTLSEMETLKLFANGEESYKKALEFKKQFNFAKTRNLVRLLPGAKETLEWCSNRYLLALATNRGDSVWALIDELGISGYFQLVYTTTNSERPKPDPWIAKEVCRQFSIGCNQLLFVGDAEADILCAQNAGAIAVAVGDNWKKSNAKPDFVLPDVSHLVQLLSSNE